MSRSSTDDDLPAVGGDAPEQDVSVLEVGYVGRPHGLAGDVVVSLVSNRPERLLAGSEVLVKGDPAAEPTPWRVLAARPHQNRLIVRFEGVTSREGAEAIRGTVLYAEPIDDPAAMYAHDLVGAEVVEVSGRSRGPVVALQANPASDLLVGEDGWLVPLRFVVERQPGRIVVDVPEGLFE